VKRLVCELNCSASGVEIMNAWVIICAPIYDFIARCLNNLIVGSYVSLISDIIVGCTVRIPAPKPHEE
jgi:hypothetical protein